MEICVTGAAGFIGSHFSEYAARLGHNVWAVDNLNDLLYPSSLKIRNLEFLRRQTGIRIQVGDVGTAIETQGLAGLDVVVNFAAMPGLTPSWSTITAYADANIGVVARILDKVRTNRNVKFVQISTSSVYGKGNFDVENGAKPISPYGETKLAAENLCKLAAEEHSLAVTVLRLFSVYGPRQRPDMAYTKICQALHDGSTFTIYGDGLQTRANTYVGDLMPAILNACEKGQGYEVFDLSGGERVALLDAIAILESEFNRELTVQFDTPRAGDQSDTFPSYEHAAHSLGYVPITSIHDGLASQAKWFLESTSSL